MYSLARSGFALLCHLLLFAGTVCAQFVEVTTSQSITNINEGTPYGNGVSFYDFNHDGWDDLTLANGDEWPRFFVNEAGNFNEVFYGIGSDVAAQYIALQWVDYDNDGDEDFFFTQYGGQVGLWRNDGNFSFTDVTAVSGFPTLSMQYYGAAWADFDHNGYLDVYVAKYYNPVDFPGIAYSSRLYSNNGDGTFSDKTILANVLLPPRTTFQPVWLDYDHDGWDDLYLIIDRTALQNEMYHNNGDGTFTCTTDQTLTGLAIDAMTGTIADFDNDLDLDIYVTNGYPGNHLLRNEGNGQFTDISVSSGTQVFAICWGALWLDEDNDGWQDLFVGTTVGMYASYPNYFYLNQQDGTFTEGMEEMGISDDVDATLAAAMGDINNDGYMDYVTGNNDPWPNSIWQNEASGQHWIGFTLEGSVSNRNGIGAWITAYAGDAAWTRYTQCGENYLGQDSRKHVFGLGSLGAIDSVRVEWPSGIVETYMDLPVDQYHHLVEAASFSIPFDLFAADTVLCAGETIMLDAGPGATYTWNTGHAGRYLLVTTPGEYLVTVVNAYGYIEVSEPVQIAFSEAPVVEIVSTPVSCAGSADGFLVAMVSGFPFEVDWQGGGVNDSLVGLSPGSYSFAAVNEDGCATTGVAEVISPDTLELTASVSDASCFGASDASLEWQLVGGTAPYTWLSFPEEPEAMSAGEYVLEVMDANNCQAQLVLVVGQPDALEVTVTPEPAIGESGGSAVVDIQGGIPPYAVEWSSGSPAEMAVMDLSPGEHTVLVTDANGCSWTQGFMIDWMEWVSPLEASARVFPQPAAASWTLCLSSGMFPADITLFGMDGKAVYQYRQVGECMLHTTPGLPAGRYVLEVKGPAVYRKAFVSAALSE